MNALPVIARLVNYSGSRFLFSGVSVLTLATHLYGQTAPVVAGPEVQTVTAARQVLDQFFNLQELGLVDYLTQVSWIWFAIVFIWCC